MLEIDYWTLLDEIRARYRFDFDYFVEIRVLLLWVSYYLVNTIDFSFDINFGSYSLYVIEFSFKD